MRRRETKIRTRRRLSSLPPALRPAWWYARRLHRLTVRCAAPFVQAISRRRGGQLPHRAARTVEEIVARGEGTMVVARVEERLVRAPPAGIPAAHPSFVNEAEELVPRVALAELPRGRVLGRYRAVITARGTLVGELSPYFSIRTPNEHPVFADVFAPGPTVVPGRVGVLAARGDVSYYHFMTDALPRLALLEQLKRPPEQLYVPASLPFQKQLIDILGIPHERLIDADRVPHLQAETLVVPGLPDADLKTPPWIVSFLRERLLPPGMSRVPGERLYVTRGRQRGNRIVSNEPAVIGALKPLGFKTIDTGGLPVSHQIKAFAQAELIVAPHGGALTNLAFASPGAAVIELFASDWVQGCYWKLAACVPGLTYSYLVCGERRRGRAMHGVDSDITVDIGELLALLERLGQDAADDPHGARATIR